MWKPGCVLGIAILAATSPAVAQDRVASWRSDLDLLARELPDRHANLFHTIERAAWDRDLKELTEALPRLTEVQRLISLSRLLARIGDGHTGLFLPWDRGVTFRRLPLELWVVPDGLLVLRASAEYRELAGAVITDVDGKPVAALLDSIRPITPLDNAHGAPGMAAYYLVLPELWQAFGFSRSSDAVSVSAVLPDRSRRAVTIRSIQRDSMPALEWGVAPASLPLWLRNRDRQYWMEWLPEDSMLYVQVNSSDIGAGAREAAFRAFTDTIADQIQFHKPDKVVIDLRWNSGGRSQSTTHLVSRLGADRIANRRGHLFTIVGRNTFSAASLLAVDLQRYTETLVVGEPGAGKPNAFGELRRLDLPNIGVQVRYSALFHQRSDPWDTRPAIYPNVWAHATAADFQTGRDPALTAIRDYAPGRPLGPAVWQRTLDTSLDAALSWFDQLMRDRDNTYAYSATDLSVVGDSLAARGKYDDAERVLKYNLAHYPWAASAHWSLAEFYRSRGRNLLAIESYRRVLALDKRYSTARAHITSLSVTVR